MTDVDILILGAGLSGLSAGYHQGHNNCVILEKNSHPFGHIYSRSRNGFTWDEGPHVSFTRDDYVRHILAESVKGDFLEYPVKTINYHHGNWIYHPAQSHLYQIPEPLRTECLHSLQSARRFFCNKQPPENYGEWLDRAFGKVFANEFSREYTRKYWTVEPEALSVDWIGKRVFYPSLEDVLAGYQGPPPAETHYISHVRYPARGGYQAFGSIFVQGANVHLNTEVVQIDLEKKIVQTADARAFRYQKLINTLPLPLFIRLANPLPETARDAAQSLRCSKLLLVNVSAAHPTRRKENWIYVYDKEMLSTRINCTELLSPHNAPSNTTGIQVEIYFPSDKPKPNNIEEVASQIITELKTLGLLDKSVGPDVKGFDVHTQWVEWANVIFTRETRHALEIIWQTLQAFGLAREPNDTHPLPEESNFQVKTTPQLAMAGRFGQWKYSWTDDCILRGRHLKTLFQG